MKIDSEGLAGDKQHQLDSAHCTHKLIGTSNSLLPGISDLKH